MEWSPLSGHEEDQEIENRKFLSKSVYPCSGNHTFLLCAHFLQQVHSIDSINEVIQWWNYSIHKRLHTYWYVNVSIFQILWHNSDGASHHTCGLYSKGEKALIDPKRHSIHSARWQPSLFSKESTLSLLHSSRASPPAWWIMSSVSSKTRLIPDRYTTLYKMVLTACRSQRGQTCQQAIGLNSLSMTRCLGWF